MTPKSKGFMQRMSVVSGLLSFLLAAVSSIGLYIKVAATGFDNPVSASLLACCFFFVFAGIVLTIIGRSDLPSFRFED